MICHQPDLMSAHCPYEEQQIYKILKCFLPSSHLQHFVGRQAKNFGDNEIVTITMSITVSSDARVLTNAVTFNLLYS